MKTIPQDLANHAIANFAAIQVGATLGLAAMQPFLISVAIGLALAVAVSAWKEFIHDKLQRRGEFSWKDMAANGVGAALGLWPWALVYWVVLPRTLIN